MSTIESITTLPHQLSALSYLQATAKQAHQLSEGIRASYRDQAAALSRTAGSLSLIGSVEYIDQVMLPETAANDIQVHQRAVIRRNGHQHALLITQPLPETNRLSNFIFHGITQDPTTGGAANLHSRIAAASPEMCTVSVHSDGVGELETQLSPTQAALRSFRRMARARGEIGRVLFKDYPVHNVALSMGTVHAVNMAHQNIEAKYINLQQLTFFSPAIVTPDQARYVMGRKFLPSVYDEQKAGSSSNLARAVAAYREIRGLPIACISNALYLTRGTETDLLMEVAANYKMNISYGLQDPLAQPPLYKAAAAAYAKTFHVYPRDGGHPIGPYMDEVVALVTSASADRQNSSNLSVYAYA